MVAHLGFSHCFMDSSYASLPPYTETKRPYEVSKGFYLEFYIAFQTIIKKKSEKGLCHKKINCLLTRSWHFDYIYYFKSHNNPRAWGL